MDVGWGRDRVIAVIGKTENLTTDNSDQNSLVRDRKTILAAD
jgi:hypothetical protein